MKTRQQLILELNQQTDNLLVDIIERLTLQNLENVIFIVNRLLTYDVVEARKLGPLQKFLKRIDNKSGLNYLVNQLVLNIFDFYENNKSRQTSVEINDVIKKCLDVQIIQRKFTAILDMKKELRAKLEKDLKRIQQAIAVNEDYYQKILLEREQFSCLNQYIKLIYWFGADNDKFLNDIAIKLECGQDYLSAFIYCIKSKGYSLLDNAKYVVEQLKLFYEFNQNYPHWQDNQIQKLFITNCHLIRRLIFEERRFNENIKLHLLAELDGLTHSNKQFVLPTMTYMEVKHFTMESLIKGKIEDAFEKNYKYRLQLMDITEKEDSGKLQYTRAMWDVMMIVVMYMIEDHNKQLPLKTISLKPAFHGHLLQFYQNKLFPDVLNETVLQSLREQEFDLANVHDILDMIISLHILMLQVLPNEIKNNKNVTQKTLVKQKIIYAELLCKLLKLCQFIGKKNIEMPDALIHYLHDSLKFDVNVIEDVIGLSLKASAMIDDLAKVLNVPNPKGISTAEMLADQKATEKLFREFEHEFLKQKEQVLKVAKKKVKKSNAKKINLNSAVPEAESDPEVVIVRRHKSSLYDDAQKLLARHEYDEALLIYAQAQDQAYQINNHYDYELATIEIVECLKLKANEYKTKISRQRLKDYVNPDEFTAAIALYNEAKVLAEKLQSEFELEVKEDKTTQERDEQICKLSLSMTLVLADIEKQLKLTYALVDTRLTSLQNWSLSLLAARNQAKKTYRDASKDWNNNPNPSNYFADINNHVATSITSAELMKTQLATVHTDFVVVTNEYLHVHGQDLLPKIGDEKVTSSNFELLDTKEVISNIAGLPGFRELQVLLTQGSDKLPPKRLAIMAAEHSSLRDAPTVKTLFNNKSTNSQALVIANLAENKTNSFALAPS